MVSVSSVVRLPGLFVMGWIDYITGPDITSALEKVGERTRDLEAILKNITDLRKLDAG